tara:strand:+ start:29976 stop:30563 length:588 start_codon:yes stop_codon:yes gene_type:complete
MNDSLILVFTHLGLIMVVTALIVSGTYRVLEYVIPLIMGGTILLTEYAKENNIKYGLEKLNDKEHNSIATLISSQVISLICIIGIVGVAANLNKGVSYMIISGVIMLLTTFILMNDVLYYVYKRLDKKKYSPTYRYGMLILYLTIALLFQLGFLYLTRTTHNFSYLREEVRNNAKIARSFNLSKLKSKFTRTNNV